MRQDSTIVAFASDDRYAPYTGIAVQSLCEHTHEQLHIVILENDISAENKHKIELIVKDFLNVRLQWIYIDVEKYFHGFKLVRDISLSMYSRYLLPSFFPSEKRLLYMDVDVVVLKDVADIFNDDSYDNVLAAVVTLPNDGGIEVRNRLELSEKHKYFNSGVLVFDCQRWCKEGIFQSLMELEEKYRSRLIFGDQDLLNKYFDDNYRKLSPIYNATNNEITNELHKKAVIRHFEGGVKPWKQHPLKIWAKRYKAKYKGLWEFWKVAIRSPFKDELFAKYPVEKWIMERFMRHS